MVGVTFGGDRRLAPGMAGLHMVAGLLPLLRPEEQVFAAMLDGWGMMGDGKGIAMLNLTLP